MKLKTIAAALVLALTPGLATAYCGAAQSASACGDGQVWDAQARVCVTSTTS